LQKVAAHRARNPATDAEQIELKDVPRPFFKIPDGQLHGHPSSVTLDGTLSVTLDGDIGVCR
jgi:hypothetical protein